MFTEPLEAKPASIHLLGLVPKMRAFSDMKLFIRALWVMASLAAVAGAQHAGDIPPALAWTKLKGNCPASLDWASLRGTAVVVSLSSDFVLREEVDEWNKTCRSSRASRFCSFRW